MVNKSIVKSSLCFFEESVHDTNGVGDNLKFQIYKNESMRLRLKISFAAAKFSTAADVLNTFLPALHFEPKAIRSARLNEDGYVELEKADMLKQLEKVDPPVYSVADGEYSWEDIEDNSFFYIYNPFTETKSCSISSEEIDSRQLRNYINAARPKDFFMAYYYNPFNTIEQNEIIISNLEYKGRPHAHLKKTFDPLLEQEVIDIFDNPGHEKLTTNTWLYAAPEMWFGKHALQYFDKDKSINFPNAIKTEKLDEDLIYIKLFEPTAPDYETTEILEVQKDFREYSGMNIIEKYFDDIYWAKVLNQPRKIIVHRIVVKPQNTEEE